MCRRWLDAGRLAVLGLSLAALTPWARAQGFRTVIESRQRVFPSLGAGVTALKRDSAGRFYILAKPANTISVYSTAGELVGHIPNAASAGAIRYAVDIDVTPGGLIAVADRGMNAIEVFRPDGSLVSRTPIVAPTSVVALGDDEFAVTSLMSKRLVEVISRRGEVLRSFGEPGDIGDQPDNAQNDAQKTLHNFGMIYGDSAGDIYFAFTGVPDPTVRKYDRYGYLAYQSSIPKREFGAAPSRQADRVQLLFGLSDLSFSHEAGGWLSIGSSKDVQFGGDVGAGIGESLRRGYGFGEAVQQQSAFGGGPLAATFSGLVNSQGTSLQLGMGRAPRMGGRFGNRMTLVPTADQSGNQGGLLQFSDSNRASADESSPSGGSQDFSGTSGSYGTTAELGMFGSSDSDTSPVDAPDSALGAPNNAMTTDPMGLPAPFVVGSTMDSLYFRPRGLDNITGGGGPLRTGAGAAGAHSRGRVGAGGADNFPHFGYHGRFNAGVPSFTTALRINLGNLGQASEVDKPEIRAVAADPQTHDIWAAIGDTVVEYSQDGNPLGIYYLSLPGGGALKPTALLVEPDRLIVAADPWGVFEFARPDKPSPSQQFNIAPQVVPQPQ